MEKTPSDIEKKLIEKDLVILAIGMIIAMLLVWLTLSVPPKERRAYTSKCYNICKAKVNEEMNFQSSEFLARTRFIVEMGECMDHCKEVIDENGN